MLLHTPQPSQLLLFTQLHIHKCAWQGAIDSSLLPSCVMMFTRKMRSASSYRVRPPSVVFSHFLTRAKQRYLEENEREKPDRFSLCQNLFFAFFSFHSFSRLLPPCVFVLLLAANHQSSVKIFSRVTCNISASDLIVYKEVERERRSRSMPPVSPSQ